MLGQRCPLSFANVRMWATLSVLVVINFQYCRTVTITNEAAVDEGSLVLVHLLYRHGDRTPIEPYPSDPYRNSSYWPEGYGQLTNLGKEHEYELGQWIRRKYGQFLSDLYNPDDIYVRSTDVDRTLMSAETVLAALYLPEGRQQWHQNLSWQPVPIHTMPETDDEVLASKKFCPKYQSEMIKVENSKRLQKINKKNKELYNYLTKHTGKTVQDIQSVAYIYDTLFIESSRNLTLPEWTKTVFPDKMISLAKFSFQLSTLTKELKRLKAGPLLKEMITNMLKKVNSSLVPDRKMMMYSAHDSTISSFLNTLNVFNDMLPPYSAAVTIELRTSNSQDYSVKLLYKNSSAEEPFILTIPGCSDLCPLEKFVSLTKSVVPNNWDKECHLQLTERSVQFSMISIITLVISAALAVLLVISVLLSTSYCRKQRQETYYYHRVQTES